jgi:hypothetical protein
LAVLPLFFLCRWRCQHQERDFQPRRDHTWGISRLSSMRSAADSLCDESQDLIGSQCNDAKHY